MPYKKRGVLFNNTLKCQDRIMLVVDE